MSNKEIKEFNAIIKAYVKKVGQSESASKKLLKDIGVITEKGNIRKPYKALGVMLKQSGF